MRLQIRTGVYTRFHTEALKGHQPDAVFTSLYVRHRARCFDHGAKLKTINWDLVNEYCAMQCTQIEIASKFDISVDSLERACKPGKAL